MLQARFARLAILLLSSLHRCFPVPGTRDAELQKGRSLFNARGAGQAQLRPSELVVYRGYTLDKRLGLRLGFVPFPGFVDFSKDSIYWMLL